MESTLLCLVSTSLILSAWGSDIATDPEKPRILRFFVKFTLKKADLVHTCDEVGMSRLIELGCDRAKIFVQHWGVDTNLFSPQARSPSLRKTLGINCTYSVIMTRKWFNHRGSYGLRNSADSWRYDLCEIRRVVSRLKSWFTCYYGFD